MDDRKIGKRNRSHVCLVSEFVVPSASLFPTFLLATIFLCTPTISVSQSQAPDPTAALPEAPEPQIIKHERTKGGPCRVVPRSESSGAAVTATAAVASTSLSGISHEPGSTQPPITATQTALPPCPTPPLINWFARFLNGPEVKPLTPAEKARLAVRNLFDPFNAVTILGNAAIGIGSDAHSPYGPGMPGFGRYVGVSYSQDMTGEFFNTFLIPSVFHQDPHYHRMPHASIPRRIGHAIVQVVWTQGDDGKGMLNYANLIGNAIDDEIGNLYIPGRETNLSASAARYGIGLAIAPTDNFITEFIPDFAKRIHVRVVLVQRIIDQVAKTNGSGT